MGKNELNSKAASKPPSGHSDPALNLLHGLSGAIRWTSQPFLRLSASQVSCLAGFWFSPALLCSLLILTVQQGCRGSMLKSFEGKELVILLCWNWLSRSEHHPVGNSCCFGNPGDMGFQNWLPSATVWDSKGIQGADLLLKAVVMSSGRMPLISTLFLGELASWHLVHYRINLIWHYWFPEA